MVQIQLNSFRRRINKDCPAIVSIHDLAISSVITTIRKMIIGTFNAERNKKGVSYQIKKDHDT